MTYNYKPLSPGDEWITDDDTGAVIGFRTNQEVSFFPVLLDKAASMSSGQTTVTGRNIVIPTGTQSLVAGGVTISSGSITTGGEFVAIAY